MDNKILIILAIAVIAIGIFVIKPDVDGFFVEKPKVTTCSVDSECTSLSACNLHSASGCYEKLTGYCNSGYCGTLSSFACSTPKSGCVYYCYDTTSCTTGKTVECILDSHCSSGKECDTSTLKCSNIGDCLSHSDCASDEFCNSSWMCVDQICLSDSDCSLGYDCNTESDIHSCEIKGDCVVDSDCSAGYECVDWACSLKGDCIVDSDCDDGYKCSLPALSITDDDWTCIKIGECTADSDCSFGDVCDTDSWTCKDVPVTTTEETVTVESPEIIQLPDEPVEQEKNFTTPLAVGLAIIGLIIWFL